MKTLNKGILAALTVVVMASCDPYAKVDTGTPVVIGAIVSQGCGVDGCAVANEGTESPAGVWTVSNVPSDCTPAPTIINDMTGVIFVKFNKLLDGFSVQTDVDDCTPFNGWLTVTPAAPVGQQWYSCYDPSSPSPDEGATVAIFRAPASPLAEGWSVAGPIGASATAVTSYRVTGSVSDKQGNPVLIDVTAEVDPNPVAQTPSLSAIEVAGPAVNLTWGNGACAAAPTYTVERTAGVAAGAACPSTFTTLQAGIVGRAYTDSTITAGQKYCYQVFVTAGGADGATSDVASNVPAAPAAPTFGTVTNASVVVNWSAVAGALTYNVQRAPDVAGSAGTYANITTAVAGLTYTNTGLTANTKYWYRVIAVGAGGSSANGAGATVTTLP